jgi:dTDP-L-rhamnose 4-epimerase
MLTPCNTRTRIVTGQGVATLRTGDGGRYRPGPSRGCAPEITGEYRLGDVRHITAASDRIQRELGWRVTVPFAEGVAEFAATPPGRALAARATA